MKDISELIGSKYPLIQGAMGVICNPEMVAAVSDAGGYGLLATAFLNDPDKLKKQVEAVKKLTDKPFGANLMAVNPKSIEFAEILAQAGIEAVTTSAGSPKTLVAFLKERGVKVLHVVANVANAVKAAGAGVDAIIAEGSESGGVQGFNGASTMVLVPLVVDAVSIPVVAAGGIGDS
ncbi:MAG: nitronate monooxygenase, partial [Deltaproteobacteria bacterium]|nr:nitronate monooxygenase [Deltaproteobacteria bacterium]